LKIQANIRYLRRSPGNVNRESIQREREELTALILQLKEAQQAAGVAETNIAPRDDSDPVDVWDEIINEGIPTSSDEVPVEVPARQNTTVTLGPVPIEDQKIALPSNGNVSNVHRELERANRISHADHHLNRIRDLIAEKSFQYSHVIRVAPRKAVVTRSRVALKKLNNEIAGHCRAYSRCRSCLVSLGADDFTLTRLKVLNPKDIKASTAVLNPNEPGSTNIKLPWIWQTTAINRLGLLPNSDGNAEENAVAVSTTNALPTSVLPTILFECEYN
jgi:hypothetical protein